MQFIFGLNIVKNDSHFMNKEVPGENIKEPMMELIYFTQFLLETGEAEHLPELIKQFKIQYRNLGGA